MIGPVPTRPPGIALAIAAIAAIAALAVLAGLAVLAYAPGLSGFFVFDSVERVVRNHALQIDAVDAEHLLSAAYAAQAGYPQRGLAYVSLALNYLLAGGQFQPFAFKATNLAIHVLNAGLVLILAAQILSRWRAAGRPDGPMPCAPRVLAAAVLAAAIWLLHPIQLTSVLYVVQRMTSLAGTWVLAGAILFVLTRARFEAGRAYALTQMFASVFVCTALGFLCKQSALLLPAYIAVLELFVFQRERLARPRKRALLAYFGITLILPLLAASALLLVDPDSVLGGYQGRDFGPWQRLLTEARVLLFYLGLMLVPDIRRFGLYHDDIAVSTGLLEPLGTLAAVAVWVVVLVGLVWGGRRRAPWAFAGAWFLTGHAMESTLLPLELAHEHRNYLPGAGVWIVFAHYALLLWERAGRSRPLVVGALGAWLLALALVTHIRAQAWQSPATLMATLARHHPQSYRAAVGYAFNSIPADADLSQRFDAFKGAAVLAPRAIVPLLEMAKLAAAVDYFVAGEEARGDSPSARRMDLDDMRLVADRGHNQRLEQAIAAEIRHRLTDGPLPTDSVIALIGVVDCALGGNRECVALSQGARRWHDAALSNPRLADNYRAALELSLAKILVSEGDYDAAAAHARTAGDLAGDNLHYRLQEATLYALLERWGDLRAVLDEIERRFALRALSDPVFRDLRSRLPAQSG